MFTAGGGGGGGTAGAGGGAATPSKLLRAVDCAGAGPVWWVPVIPRKPVVVAGRVLARGCTCG